MIAYCRPDPIESEVKCPEVRSLGEKDEYSATNDVCSKGIRAFF